MISSSVVGGFIESTKTDIGSWKISGLWLAKLHFAIGPSCEKLTKTTKPVCSRSDGLKSIGERVCVILFVRKKWAEYSIEKASSCVLRMEDAD